MRPISFLFILLDGETDGYVCEDGTSRIFSLPLLHVRLRKAGSFATPFPRPGFPSYHSFQIPKDINHAPELRICKRIAAHGVTGERHA